MKIESWKDLECYQNAYRVQQAIFRYSENWPKCETYALTDQIRRSSRSIGANIAEAWAKRRYPAHFIAKLSDADGELQETMHWVSSAYSCGYLKEEDSNSIQKCLMQLGRQIGKMISKPEQWVQKHS